MPWLPLLLALAACLCGCAGAAGPAAGPALTGGPEPACMSGGDLRLRHDIIRKQCAPHHPEARFVLTTSGRSGKLWPLRPQEGSTVEGTVQRQRGGCAVELSWRTSYKVGGFEDREYLQDVAYDYQLTVADTRVSGQGIYREVGASGEDDLCSAPLRVEGTLEPPR